MEQEDPLNCKTDVEFADTKLDIKEDGCVL